MSTKLVKLIDYSLLPFSLVILSKTLGLYAVLHYLNIDWGIADFAGSLISATPVVFGKDLEVVATYSNLIMFIFIFTIFALQVSLLQVRKNSEKSTVFLRRIMKLRYLNIFEKGSVLYSKLLVWAVYTWLVIGFLIFDAIIGRSSGWLAAGGFVFGAAITAVLLLNIHHEFSELVELGEEQNLLKNF